VSGRWNSPVSAFAKNGNSELTISHLAETAQCDSWTALCVNAVTDREG
jgi:hypothetical protein